MSQLPGRDLRVDGELDEGLILVTKSLHCQTLFGLDVVDVFPPDHLELRPMEKQESSTIGFRER